MTSAERKKTKEERMWRRLARYTSFLPIICSPEFRVEKAGQGGKLLIRPKPIWGCVSIQLLFCAALVWALSEFQFALWAKWCLGVLAVFFGWGVIWFWLVRNRMVWTPQTGKLRIRSDFSLPLFPAVVEARMEDLSFRVESKVERRNDEDDTVFDDGFVLFLIHRDFPETRAIVAEAIRKQELAPIIGLLNRMREGKVEFESGAEAIAKRAGEQLDEERMADGRVLPFSVRPLDFEEQLDEDYPAISRLEIQGSRRAEFRPDAGSYFAPTIFAGVFLSLVFGITWISQREFDGLTIAMCGGGILVCFLYLKPILMTQRRITADFEKGELEFVVGDRFGRNRVRSYPLKEIGLLQICVRSFADEDGGEPTFTYDLNVVFDREDRLRRNLVSSATLEEARDFSERFAAFLSVPLRDYSDRR